MTAAMVRVAAVCSVLAVATPAAADDWSLHVVGSGEVAWTDNVFSLPNDTPPGEPAKESDFYTQLTPGALFTWEAPRMIQELLYEIDANLYAKNSEAHSVTQRLGWRAFFLTSPLTELSLSAQASAGSTNTFNTSTTASTGEIVLLPSGQSDFIGIDLGEGFSWQRTRELRFTQNSQLRLFQVEASGARSGGLEVGGGFGADRSWRADALALSINGNYVRLSTESGGTETTNDQVIVQSTLAWRRDLSRYWSSIVDVGAATIVPLIDASATVVQPTMGAAIAYTPEWGNAGIQVRRSVAPNLYIAQNTISDAASVSAWLPLPWLADDPLEPTLSVQSTLGVARTSILDAVTSEAVSRFHIATADVAVGWQVRPQLVLGARYQFLIQDSDDASMTEVLEYSRHTVQVTFSGRWPSRVAAEIPLRSSLRVDRADQTAVGDETATPR